VTYKEYLAKRVEAVAAFVRRNIKVVAASSAVFLILVTAGLVILLRHGAPKPSQSSTTTIDVNGAGNTVVNQATQVDPLTADTSIKWNKSISISDNSLAVDGTITEEIDENQLLTGNLFLPQGWTAEYSTTARTAPASSRVFAAYDMTTQSNNPLSSITYLRINTGAADGVKPYANSPLVKPMESQRLISDGKVPSAPILFQNKLFVIMVNQRVSVAGSYTIDCFDLITYSRCVDGANASFFPTYLSSTGASATVTTKLGTGTKDISTPSNILSIMDDGTYGHNGRLYIPGQVGNNYGVACVDLSVFRNCGFTTLGSAAAPTGANPSWLIGFVQNGSKIYGHANDMDQGNQTMVCFDIRDPGSGGGVCSGWTATTTAGVQTQYSYEHSNNYDTSGSMVMDGNKIYWAVNYRNGNTRLLGLIFPWDTYPNTQRDLGTVLSCFDVSTKLKCTGVYQYNWPRVYDGSGGEVGTEYIGPTFLWKQNGATYAICYTASGISLNGSPVESRILCHSPTDGNFLSGGAAPAILPVPSVWQGLTVAGSPSWRMSSNIKTITDTDGHDKSYFAFQYGTPGTRGGVSCFDWTTQAHCSDLPWLKYWYNMNDAVSADQGYGYDGSCMIGVSKQGFLWSFNAKTAESPCRVARTKYTASFDASKFYCDGQSHAFAWQSARLSKSSMFDFEQYNVRAYSALGGSLLASGNIKDSGALDLSSINFGSQNTLYIDVDSNVWSPTPWSNGKLPYASIRASGDDVQYCYTTRAKTYQEDIACDITKLGTSSSAVFVTDDNTFTKDKSQTVDYLQPSNKQCFKDLRVSVQPDKTRVNNGEQITYTITVANKANTDPHNRGDIGGLFNPKTAQYEATLPTGMQFVSASSGGTLSQDGSKVVWASRSLAAQASDNVTVVLQAPGPIARAKSKSNIIVASSLERTLNMSATALYNDDVYQSDNTAASQPVTFENNASPVVTNLVQTAPNPRAPATLHFTVDATDENNIASVELLNGTDVVGSMTATTTANQYEVTLTSIPEGTYNFSARATDDGTPALSTTSSSISVAVRAENIGPTVSNFSQLTNNPRAPATLNFVIDATDIDGLANVALLSESDQVLGTMTPTSTPDQYGINLQNYAAGDYVFKVRATDGASPALSTISSTVSVTVLPNLPPVISGVAQTVTSPRAPATLIVEALITDDDGITAVRLLDENNQQIGTMTPTSTPDQYGINLQNYAAGDYVFKVRATDGASPAQTTTSAPISITVLPDTPPSLSGFAQTNTSLRAPTELHFVITATDNSAVGAVQLLGTNDTILGTMQPTGQPNQYEATLTGVLEGAITYRVKASDTAQQPNISFSSSLSITVDAPLPPPPPPTPPTTPTTPTTPITPSNAGPVVSDFKQLTTKLQAPAALQFQVKVTDDSAVNMVALYEGGQEVGSMIATTTPGTYAFRTDGYKEGSYEFQVKATDNGSPAITTASEKLIIAVAARPDGEAINGSSNGANSGTLVTQTFTPVSIRSIVPEFAKANVETGFRVLANSVGPISPTTAKALPYATIGMLMATSAVYMVLGFNQIRNRNKLRAIIDRFKNAERGRKNYIQLTSHYINTPIAIMKGTVELLQVKNKIAATLSKNVMRYIDRLSKSAQQLLEGDETVALQTKQTEQLLHGFEPKKFIKDPAVVVPIASGVILIILLNSLFIWSKKYGASVSNFALQSALLVAGGIAMIFALRYLRQQKFATQAVTNELSFEQLIQDKQTQFIKSNGDELTFDIGQIQQLTPEISTADPDNRFTTGLHDISYAVERLRYLDELTKAQKTTIDPIQLRVPTELLVQNAQEKAGQKQVTVSLDMASDVSARIDEKAYRQLLTSTLDNAVKFSKSGGTVKLKVTSKGHQTLITISDNGIGIAKDKLDQLFNAFSRATDTETFDYEGMGIDLYMDKLIVDKWAGTIDVASELGKGTTVTIMLPS